LSPAVLVLTLVAPAIDLWSLVLPGVLPPIVTVLATSAATAALLLVWLRFPRTSWLAAATLAVGASLALRLAGVDGAAALSLLSVIALGLGGGFASPTRDAEAFLSL
jgi:hypothetical protein